MASRLMWYGDAMKRRVSRAAKAGIDDTTAAAAIYAKGNHPGWRNQTGTAEGSIRNEAAEHVGLNRIRGRFGSWAVDYMIWLELKHGSALRNAADVEFPTLGARIHAHYRRGI